MLMFNGELSKECKKYAINRQKKLTTLFVGCISIFLSIPFIVLTFIYNWIFILAVLIILLISIFQYFSFRGKTLDFIIPTSILISDKTVESNGKRFSEKRQISHITKVVDHGDWYHIFFRFPYKSQNFLIQKSLIVDGTIKEFEDIFKDKIVRKIK